MGKPSKWTYEVGFTSEPGETLLEFRERVKGMNFMELRGDVLAKIDQDIVEMAKEKSDGEEVE